MVKSNQNSGRLLDALKADDELPGEVHQKRAGKKADVDAPYTFTTAPQ